MAKAVVWSPAALRELDELRVYLEENWPELVERVIQETFARAELLSTFPHLGSPVPLKQLRDQGYRQLRVGQQRMLYKVDGDRIWIAAVVHERQDLLKSWRAQQRGPS